LQPCGGASAGKSRNFPDGFFLFLFGQKFFNGFFIEFVGRTLDDLKGAQGAFSQAGPQSVAIKVGDHAGFPIYYLQCALGTGRHTVAASVTEFFVNFDNLSQGFHVSLLLVLF
jgi:hypothetical protein